MAAGLVEVAGGEAGSWGPPDMQAAALSMRVLRLLCRYDAAFANQLLTDSAYASGACLSRKQL